jgi:branched-chain amino acid transport system permease protein
VSPVEYIVQQLINGLSLGSIYALVAIGLAMVFSILRLINFAHGDLMMVGAYTMVFLMLAGVSFLVAAVAAGVVVILTGVLMERIAYRPLRGAPLVASLLTSLAVTWVLENSFVMTVTAHPRNFPLPDWLSPLHWLTSLGMPNVVVSNINLTTVITSLALMAVLTFIVKFTKVGASMRATAEDLMAAQLMGININKVIVWAFILASGMASVAGLLWAARVGKVEPLMGFIPGLKAFVAAVIGGFGSIPGAVLGGFILGFAEVLIVGFMPEGTSGYRDAVVFLILILMLLIRPNGILGSTDREKI